jgi:tetratricopeptide (TPR) repeat protein
MTTSEEKLVPCPHCGVALDPPPKATKKCPACGQKMHLKRVAWTEERRLMTDAEVEENDREWAKFHRRNELIRRAGGIGFSETDYEDAAEKLYQQDVSAYRQHNPEGLNFALGRYAAFLISQERDDEAAVLLEEAIARKTDLPGIWSDYQLLLLRRKDIDKLCWAIEAQAKRERVPRPPLSDRILGFARRADRSGDSQLAWTLAEKAFRSAVAVRDDAGRWTVLGLMGELHEKAGDVDRAVEIWAQAFDEGSKDPTSADRLSLHLERRKDHEGASRVIDAALQRGLPANIEERLRKRGERCRARAGGSTRAADVAAFSVRRGADAVSCIWQTRIKPPIRDVDIVDGVARCFGISKGTGSLVDIGLSTGQEMRRASDLPAFSYLEMAPSGWAIAIERTAAIGRGETRLFFLDPTGSVHATSTVPDATSQIALGPDIWFVGCRDGGLYAFDLAGTKLWRWATPGSRGHVDNPYDRPCPYYVASAGDFAVAASMSTLYAIGRDGRLLWQTELPTDPPIEHTVWLSQGGKPGQAQALTRLGLTRTAGDDEIKAAYRTLAKVTHPDLHPGDVRAAERFREVHAAYESLMAGNQDDGGFGLAVRVSFSVGPPLATFVAARATSIVAGSSNGRVCVFDSKGRLTEAHVLGKYTAAPAALHVDGSLAAVWSEGTMFFFSAGAPVSSTTMESRPSGMRPWGDSIVVWRYNNLQVVERSGAVAWEVEFAKAIATAEVVGDELICAAGALMAFGRSGA